MLRQMIIPVWLLSFEKQPTSVAVVTLVWGAALTQHTAPPGWDQGTRSCFRTIYVHCAPVHGDRSYHAHLDAAFFSF